VADVRAISVDVDDAVRELDEVLDEVAPVAVLVRDLAEAALTELATDAQRRLLDDRCRQTRSHEDVRGRERRADDRLPVVRDVEGRREVASLSRRAGVRIRHAARVADVGVGGELRLAVLAGVPAVARLNDGLAIAGEVVGNAETRNRRR